MLAIDEVGRTVSIHAPAGGATDYYESNGWRVGSFNPRARGGRDQ